MTSPYSAGIWEEWFAAMEGTTLKKKAATSAAPETMDDKLLIDLMLLPLLQRLTLEITSFLIKIKPETS